MLSQDGEEDWTNISELDPALAELKLLWNPSMSADGL